MSFHLAGARKIGVELTLTSMGSRPSSLTAVRMNGDGRAVARKRIRPRMKTISGVGGFGCRPEQQTDMSL